MIVGLTGGTGSGKSTVAEILRMLGCPVFNSDLAARELYGHPEIKQRVTALLGKSAYTAGGQIDRAFISSRIFSDDHLRSALNAIIHPAVARQFSQFLTENPAELQIKESALLFETGLNRNCDRIVVVTAPLEIRVSRLHERDSLTREDILRRISSQWPDEKKTASADFVIFNDENSLVVPQILRIHQHLKADAKKRLPHPEN